MEHRDTRQGAALRRWLDAEMDAYDERVIAFDQAVAIRTAALHIPDPRLDRDAIIAAGALVHGYTVVTRNIGDFEIDGLEVINPWEPL